MKFRSCSINSCPKGKQEFREQQCSEFDGKHFNINGLTSAVRWLPKYSGISVKDRCKLFCRVSGTTSYYQLKDRVVDGTPCGKDTYDICVQGLCRQAGCDHVLNSKAKRDKCGICGGDNSSCRTLSGTFNSAHYGYNIVIKIPIGATNLEIYQHSYSGNPEDDNYLALSNTQGIFFLNGNFVVSLSKKEITMFGVDFEYSGSNNTIERINTTGWLEEDILLQVLCVGNLYSPDVRYSFSIPVEDGNDLFTWNAYGPWQVCSKMCQGLQRRKVTCIRKTDHLELSDERCEHIALPKTITEPCNTDCELRWHNSGKSECSARCGPGYRSLDIHCMKYSVSKELSVPVDDKYCADQEKPPIRESCHGDCLLTSWHYTGWSECSVTCGKGTQHRQVWCQVNDEQLQHAFCSRNSVPESERLCELNDCAAWQVGPWGVCSVTCGHGYQMRAVKCVSGIYGTILDDETECNSAIRPRDNQECEMSSCTEIIKLWPVSLPVIQTDKVTQWRFGSWTPCTVTCGNGIVTRQVVCVNHHQQIDENYCDPEGRPAKEQECKMPPCHHEYPGYLVDQDYPSVLKVQHSQDNAGNHPSPGGNQWRTGPWGACSSTCAGGFHHRVVVCQNGDGRSASFCDVTMKPPASKNCDLGPCPRWNYGNWGECTQTCGDGVKTRLVICQLPNGQVLSDQNCETLEKPPNAAQCNLHSCPDEVSWHRGPWELVR
uniref:Uncharacterized protein n=1 Tax=Sphaerodactylus townsendi TaxID=933632 RepID=A0ACB8FPN3_9SAUR